MNNFNSPLEAFLYWESTTPHRIFLKQPVNGKIIEYSYAQAGEEARKIASVLNSYNFPKYSHIALLSKNCAHWLIADLAIMMSGHVSIPIYPTLDAKSIEYILNHSESKAIIIGKLDDFESQRSGLTIIPKISVDLYGVHEGALWSDLVQEYKPIEHMILPDREDLHTIIYTSGTTGTPKGAMHTAGNFIESATIISSVIDLPLKPRLFSYLPLAHVAERMAIEVNGFVLGAEFSFPESLVTFASDLEQCQPQAFFAVPRIWAKFQEKILGKIPQKKLDILLMVPIINMIIKKRLKQKLGLKHAQVIVSGAAPLSKNLMYWFKKIDITILQGYGMTEDCIISHGNLPDSNKIGTVGKVMPHVKIKLSPEGEICIKNSCLFNGYYKAPEVTASVFDKEGYFKTGDIGEYDHDGFLTITGRVKDQFKTDKGKYISPSTLELPMLKNTDIEQICVVGTGIPQPIALVILSELGKVKSRKELYAGLIKTLNQVNQDFKTHEKIEKIVIMKEEWRVDNGLITPTLKVKRNAIEKIHQPYYAQWFKMDEKVIFE